MKYKILIINICIISLLAGCKKFVTINNPNDELSSSTVFKDSTTAESALIGLSSQMMRLSDLLTSSGFTVMTGLTGDEIDCAANASYTDYLEANENSISVGNSPNGDMYRYGYIDIYQANACIEGLEKTNELSVSQKNRLIGEAKFIRAFVYYYMVNLYGALPLETTTDYTVNATLKRSSTDSIYIQIINDLTSAVSLLPSEYIDVNKTRPNKFAAKILLARVYLATRQWQLAKENAEDVINSGLYQLTSLSNVFLKGSNETIYQFYPSSLLLSYNSTLGFVFVPTTSATSRPAYTVNNYLYNSFEGTDLRKTNWTNSKIVKGVTYVYPYKYKIKYTNSAAESYEYDVVFRLAECYLIRAEANDNLGNYSSALDDINLIRQRAGLETLTNNDMSAIKNEIINENRWEFFAEWGHRWIDIRRWSIIDDVLKSEKASYESTDSLFPIPRTEIVKNPNLIQNLGY